jgi:Ca-activated chloride channel family protein
MSENKASAERAADQAESRAPSSAPPREPASAPAAGQAKAREAQRSAAPPVTPAFDAPSAETASAPSDRRGGGDDLSPSTPATPSIEPFAPPEPCDAPPVEPPDPRDEQYKDWGTATYLSNDETMSLSSAQRILYAIDRFLPLPPQHIRRHELLNYFTFDTAAVQSGNDFSVQAGISPKSGEPGVFTLALGLQGRRMDTATRRNLSLTLVIDKSGSMREEGRMTYLKRGLHRMLRELKNGDMLHLVTFNTAACVPLANFVMGRDSLQVLERAIDGIQPQGNTDLHAGLLRGYQLADAAWRPGYNHRVLLITDAQANTGETNPELMSVVSRFYDSRQIRLSGIGVGRDFNDRLLDRLTERGKGAYVFLGSEAEVDATFGRRFISLVETIALDTHFLLHLPPSLRMNVFYGEESSTSRAEVQPVHFFAGTSQLFLSDVMSRRGKLREGDMFMLQIDYRDPDTGSRLREDHAFRLGDLPVQPRNVKKGQLVVEFVDGLSWMAARVPPARAARAQARGWADDEAAWECERRGRVLGELSRDLGSDPEVQRVLGLWGRYCERFEAPRGPRPAEPVREGWPGAR